MSPKGIDAQHSQRNPKRQRVRHRSSSPSHSESSSSLSEVEGDPGDPIVKELMEKKRKAKNQRRYYRRYVTLCHGHVPLVLSTTIVHLYLMLRSLHSIAGI